MAPSVLLLFISLLFYFVNSVSSSILYGGTTDLPISTDPSVQKPCACDSVPGPLFQDTPGPYPTNSWWIGLGTAPGQDSFAAGPYPYLAKSLPTSVLFSQPSTRRFDNVTLHEDWNNGDLQVGSPMIPSNMSNHKVVAYDSLTVTIEYFDNNNNPLMTTYLVQGSPYMTFKYSSTFVSIGAGWSGNTLASLNGVNLTAGPLQTFTGSTFYLTQSNGLQWVIYLLNGTMELSGNIYTLTSTSNVTGIIRVARLPDATDETLALLTQYSGTYATSASISYSAEGDTGFVTFNYNSVQAVGNESLLVLSWPHHRESMVNAIYEKGISYSTLKGRMVGVVGNVWTMQYNLTKIDFYTPNLPVSSCLPYINKQLTTDVSRLGGLYTSDIYFYGGALESMARLAVIADQLNRQDLVSQVVSILERSMEPWFNYNTSLLGYETMWGGVCSYKGVTNIFDNFGNGYYNDHHFHYGYLLYSAAVIVKYDPHWLHNGTVGNGKIDRYTFLTELMRDIGNPSSSDPYFPVARNKDWFAGHSWASGIANGAGDRNQESFSEATNAYYGLYLFAKAANFSQQYQDFARIMLAMEIQAGKFYWHLYPNADGPSNNPDPAVQAINQPYPEPEIRNITTFGNIFSTEAGAFSLFGNSKSQVAGIITLPISPVSELYIDPAWIRGSYNWTKSEFKNPALQGFTSIMMIANAVVNPRQAWIDVQPITDYGTGNSATNAWWFIATRDAAKDDSYNNPVCASIAARVFIFPNDAAHTYNANYTLLFMLVSLLFYMVM